MTVQRVLGLLVFAVSKPNPLELNCHEQLTKNSILCTPNIIYFQTM